MSEPSYRNPAAFRQALSDRLRAVSKESKWTHEQLQRQVAYDRLLARLYLTDDRWIVKGATALLARQLSVRASLDIDLFRAAQREVAEAELRDAAAKDIGDWFRFELGPTRAMDAAQTARIPVTAYIGVTPWMRFHVDLSGDRLTMTGDPDDVPPLAQLALLDLTQPGYRVYPLVDHVADKVAATFETHGAMEAPSTRYRDLVDLVAIVSGAAIEAEAQKRALRSELARRSIAVPQHFDVPDRALWERGYAAEAERSLLTQARSLDEALEVVRAFIDPVLDGTAVGLWDPQAGAWVPDDTSPTG